MAKLPKNWFETIEAAQKWGEKKEALDLFVAAADTLKIADGDFTELVKVLKKNINDANLVVGQTAIRAIFLLSKGLPNSGFSPHAKAMVNPNLDLDLQVTLTS